MKRPRSDIEKEIGLNPKGHVKILTGDICEVPSGNAVCRVYDKRNVKILEAAPDMLKLLKILSADLDGTPASQWYSAALQARAVIRKIEGKKNELVQTRHRA